MYDIALVIGRFQPLCLNHISLFQKGFELANKLIIGIGTANFTRYVSLLLKENLNYEQTYIDKKITQYKNKYIFNKKIVHNFLDRSFYLKGRNFTTIEIQDVLDTENYEKHVIKILENHLIKPCMYYKIALIGENSDTIKCFSTMDIIIPRININNFHASDIRKEIAETGSSNRLGCILTKKELEMIKNSER